jgi:hypothetical protein
MRTGCAHPHRRLNPNPRHKPTHAFVCHFVPEPGVDDPIRNFRSLLKTALRRFGLRAVDVRECALPAHQDERALAQPMEDSMSAFSERIRSQKTGQFKAADFAGGRELILTIDYLEEEVERYDKTIDILHFVETQQELQLNQSKSEFLLDTLGDDPAKWKGQHIVLYQVEYPNATDEKYRYGIGIKLRAEPETAPAHKPPLGNAPTRAAAGNGSKADLDDAIPF